VTAILDLEGKILSKSGWRRICTEFHRVNCETAANCTISDTELSRKAGENEKYHLYKCLNGLIDVAVPIRIKGEHVANLFSGQFFFEGPDVRDFKQQAQRYGFDEAAYLRALKEVPVVSKEKVEETKNFLLSITQMIAS
jgi:ligand-binding sensor protein